MTGEILLPKASTELEKHHCQPAACVVTDTSSLRVICGGTLSAFTIEGHKLWSVELCDENDQHYENWSSPVALKNGACLVAFPDSGCIHVYNEHGKCLEQRTFDNILDLSGCPPNLTDDGHLITSSTSGEVFCSDSIQIKSIGNFGYDIPIPAIYPDNSLAVAGYYGTGFCRIRVSGEIVWSTEFFEADLLPTINKDNVSAVGSLNDNKSAFYSSEGERIGAYNRAAIFAEYSSDTWIALSDQYIAKLTLSGREIWGYHLHDSGVGNSQPIVDNRGYVYLIDNHHLVCLTEEGELAFKTYVDTNVIDGLCCISTGKIACFTTEKLLIIE